MVLPALTRAADHSLLWMALGAGMMATGRRRAHRAARRGLASVAVTRVLTNGGFPSRQAAAGAAFAVGAGLAEPVLALPPAGLAATVAYARVYTGARYPSDVLAGAALGAAVGGTVLRLAPTRTPDPVRVIEPLSDPQPPRSQGKAWSR